MYSPGSVDGLAFLPNDVLITTLEHVSGNLSMKERSWVDRHAGNWVAHFASRSNRIRSIVWWKERLAEVSTLDREVERGFWKPGRER